MQIIDLHGARYKDVYGLLEQVCVHGDVPFEVITGNSMTMKKIVVEIIQQFNLCARDKLGNNGALVIYESR